MNETNATNENKKLKFEKKGISFELEVIHLQNRGDIIISVSINKNKSFIAYEYKDGAIHFWTNEKVNGLNIKGVILPEDEKQEFEKMLQRAETEKQEYINTIKNQPLVFEVRNCYQGNFNGSQDVLSSMKEKQYWTEDEKETFKKITESAKRKGQTYTYHIGYGAVSDDISAKSMNIKEGNTISLIDLEKRFSKDIKELEEEAVQKKEKAEENKIKAKKLEEEAIQKAQESKKEVQIRCLGGFDGDEEYPGSEKGWVTIWQVATPEGNIVEREYPSY